MLQKHFVATSPNGRFADGEQRAITMLCMSHVLALQLTALLHGVLSRQALRRSLVSRCSGSRCTARTCFTSSGPRRASRPSCTCATVPTSPPPRRYAHRVRIVKNEPCARSELTMQSGPEFVRPVSTAKLGEALSLRKAQPIEHKYIRAGPLWHVGRVQGAEPAGAGGDADDAPDARQPRPEPGGTFVGHDRRARRRRCAYLSCHFAHDTSAVCAASSTV